MQNRVETNASQKIISTKLSTNYSFLFQDGKLIGILVEEPIESRIYYFDSENKEPKVTDSIFEDALRALISSNPKGFDILSCCFLGIDSNNSKYDIALKVFKEHWNKLYNLVVSNDVFDREDSLDALGKAYDFFKKS